MNEFQPAIQPLRTNLACYVERQSKQNSKTTKPHRLVDKESRKKTKKQTERRDFERILRQKEMADFCDADCWSRGGYENRGHFVVLKSSLEENEDNS